MAYIQEFNKKKLYEKWLNKPLNPRNTTGFNAVHFDSKKRKYRSEVCFQNRRYKCGYFDTAAEAYQAFIKKLAFVLGV